MHPTTKLVVLAVIFIAVILAIQAISPLFFILLFVIPYSYYYYTTYILKDPKMYQILEHKPSSVVLQDTTTMEIIEVTYEELETKYNELV